MGLKKGRVVNYGTRHDWNILVGIIGRIYWAMGFGDEVWDAREGRKALTERTRKRDL
jgi:hypothetical protein